jgi:hypothetical protein
MPRYFFRFVSPTQVVTDYRGAELDGLRAAHRRAVRLAYEMRMHLPDAEAWSIEVIDSVGDNRLVVLPRFQS